MRTYPGILLICCLLTGCAVTGEDMYHGKWEQSGSHVWNQLNIKSNKEYHYKEWADFFIWESWGTWQLNGDTLILTQTYYYPDDGPKELKKEAFRKFVPALDSDNTSKKLLILQEIADGKRVESEYEYKRGQFKQFRHRRHRWEAK